MIHRISAPALSLLPVKTARYLVHKTGKTYKSQAPTKQLLVDISEVILHDARTGIQRVVRGILPKLMENPPPGYVVHPVFANRYHGYRYAPVTSSCLQAGENERHEAKPVVVAYGDTFLGLDLAAHLLPRHQGQLLRWKRHGVRLKFFIYDILPLLHPHWFNPKRHRTFNRWMETLVIYGDDLICISDTVKNDLSNWLSSHYSLPDDAIMLHTIPLGGDIEATMPSSGCTVVEQVLLKHLISKPFILMVGTLEPRKGYDLAIAAFERLWQTDHEVSLVIVGKPGWKTEALQERLGLHVERNNKLFWFSNASDELLQSLYQAAIGVLLASAAEGYGLPLIEAMQHGKPVLVRDIAVFREITECDATFFDEYSIDERLEEWLQLIQCRECAPNKQHLKTWSKSVHKLRDILSLTK